jgi:adenylate cyclase
VLAVDTAAEIQNGLAEGNAGKPENERVSIRIGINLGDVIEDRSEVYGEGVNLAARLEAAAEPGGICLSGSAHDQVKGKVQVAFEDGGEEAFKNIEGMVRVWRWVPGNIEMATKPVALALPDKPSIAVLPFTNMSGDPEQEFFADGITEDIITELSRFRSLFVIARNSTFTFKGKAVDISEVCRQLGVRYVLEGSMRQAGNRARVTAQLIEAASGSHLWAERYDRDLEDIFAVQDEVTFAIVRALQPKLELSEQMRALRKPPDNLDAWENYQRGMWHLFRYSPEECEAAIAFLSRAVELDPSFAVATASLGYAHCVRILHGISPDPEGDIAMALRLGRRAAKLDENEPFAYLTIGSASIYTRRFDEALAALERAIELNPNFALAHMIQGHALWHIGKREEGVAAIDRAIRISPHDQLMWVFLASKAIALVMLEDYDEAIAVSKAAQQNPNAAIYAFLGELSALGNRDERERAADALRRARAVNPDVTVDYLDKALPALEGRGRSVSGRSAQGRRAGLNVSAVRPPSWPRSGRDTR